MKKVITHFWKLPAIGILAVAVFLLLGAGGEMSSAANSTPPADYSPPVASPWDDLRDILRDAQFALLPNEEPIVYDLGEFLLFPNGIWLPVNIASIFNLPPFDLCPSYCVTIFEDPDTRNVVLLDSDGTLVYEFLVEEDYSPAWVYEMAVIAGETKQPSAENDFPPSYEPSLITLVATLSDPFDIIPYLYGDRTSPVTPTDPNQPTQPLDIGRITAGTNDLERGRIPDAPPLSDGVVYVDAKTGDDTMTGRSAITIARGDATRRDDGPKRTLSGGMAALDEEGARTLVVREGDYSESLDLSERDVYVKIEGYVRIGEAVSKNASAAEERP